MNPILLTVAALLTVASSFTLIPSTSPEALVSPPVAQSQVEIFSQSATQPVGYSPDQIRKAYGFASLNATGTGQTLAIVNAYHAPQLASDLAHFSQQFNLPSLNGLPGTPSCTVAAGPHPCFQQVASQGKPVHNQGWAIESTLDVEWAHAIAQQADILLVETPSPSLANLMTGIDVANRAKPRVVSMSWGSNEFKNELKYRTHFNHPNTDYVAAAGDSGHQTLFPAVLPGVIGVGGTSLLLNPDGSLAATETAWSRSGGGASRYLSSPTFQHSFSQAPKRTTPDVAYNADPRTGFAIYFSASTSQHTWYSVGGTSAGTPQWAALLTLTPKPINLSKLYMTAKSNTYSQRFQDISSGGNGTCGISCQAHPGYDQVTGLGSPKAADLVPFLSH